MAEYSHSRASTVGSFGDHERDPNHDAEKFQESAPGDSAAKTSDPEKRRQSRFADQSQDDPFGEEGEGDVKYKSLHWWYADLP